jgi:diguanylate cyclase (GGDEF)-like protein
MLLPWLCFTGLLPALTRPLRFERLSIEDGLSQTAVLAILQDRAGFLWIGTEDGLNRYDGNSFTVYRNDPSDPSSLPSNFAWAIEQDDAGDLWLATNGGGIAKWERDADSFVRFGKDSTHGELAGQEVRTLHVASGSVWIGTRGQGLGRLDPASGELSHFRHDPEDPNSLSHDHVFVIVTDRQGSLWIGTDDGLNRLEPSTGRVARYLHDPLDANSLSDNRIRSIFEDRGGSLWIGTYDGGLNRLDRETGRFVHFRSDPSDPQSLSHDRVRAIFEDDAQRLWIGTADGLNLMDRRKGTFSRYTHDPADPGSLADNEVMSLFQDRSGLLWIGTKSGGLNKWNPRTWSFGHYTVDPHDPQGLGHRNVSAFSEDRSGRLWVGTFGGGLSVIDRRDGEVTQYRTRTGTGAALSDDRVMALLHDHEGTAWVGTLSGGLNRFDPAKGSFDVFRHDPADPASLSSDAIMSLFEDREGDLWVGTFGGGVSRLNLQTEAFTRFSHDLSDPATLSNPRATCFAETPDGRLWIGTDGGGLNLHDGASQSLRHVRHDPDDLWALSSDVIYSLHVDPAGDLWVGTRKGLNRLLESDRPDDKPRFESYGQADGLPNEVVYGIHSDTSGHLWLSTNRGLARFDPQSRTFKGYHRSHGLQSEEFNFGAHYRSTTGEMFFGGINGFNAFFPRRVEINTEAPAVVLTSFQKLNEPVTTDPPIYQLDAMELAHRDDLVTFEFAALDFSSPQENRYAYMMEGFDPDWVELGNLHRATYSNLPGGRYVFRVRAANSDGVWNEAGIALALHVQPAPWETWWAYGSYGLIVLLALGAVFRVQHKKRMREAEYTLKLEKEVGNRTSDLAERNIELQEVNRRLSEASLTDSLTGLRNRRFLFEEVAKDIARVRRRYFDMARGVKTVDTFDLIFMMVDLDHFKSINDSCGHAAGDQVLIEVRNILLEASRDSDTVIRWGGDEFLVIGRDSNAQKSDALAERIRSRIAGNVFTLDDGQIVRTTCSVGYASYPFLRTDPDLLTWEQVLNLADSALYVAKKKRNAWVGYLSTDRSPSDEDLLGSIREAPDELVKNGSLEIRESSDDDASSAAG